MKITVCGKGGCGKSTVSALLAKEFERMGKTVLVADSDESNYGLHRQLGVKLEVASSKISAGGLATAALAIDSSCLCPCDKFPPSPVSIVL